LPQKKSATKRLKQSKVLNEKNRAVKSRMSTAIKKAEGASSEERDVRVREAVSAIDRASKHRVLSTQAADRKKSGLMKRKDA
jgi:ribosomal protein S20